MRKPVSIAGHGACDLRGICKCVCVCVRVCVGVWVCRITKICSVLNVHEKMFGIVARVRISLCVSCVHTRIERELN